LKNVSELTTINPATEETLNTYTVMTKEEVIAIVKQARRSYEEWEKGFGQTN
jgi:acyl-CoA reductase-like NAD-dependent aldehyde dehydrogenase